MCLDAGRTGEASAEGRDAAPQAEHVHVERVAGGGPLRPRPASQRVAADHRAEPVDQRDGEGGLDRRQRDPAAPVAQEAVAVDLRRRLQGLGPGGEPSHTGSHVAVVGREPDPVLEAVGGLGRLRLTVQEQQPGRSRLAQLPQPGVLLRPTHEHHVHAGTLKASCFATVSPR